MLSRVDYADAFVLQTCPGQDRTPEEWARAVLEGASRTVRTKLLLGWSAIGLNVLDGRSDRSVLGWTVQKSGPAFVLLGADSRIGMPGELLFKQQPGVLLFATFVQQDNSLARALGRDRAHTCASRASNPRGGQPTTSWACPQ